MTHHLYPITKAEAVLAGRLWVFLLSSIIVKFSRETAQWLLTRALCVKFSDQPVLGLYHLGC